MSCCASSNSGEDAIVVDAAEAAAASSSFEPEGEPSMTEVLESAWRFVKEDTGHRHAYKRMVRGGRKCCSKQLTEENEKLADVHFKLKYQQRLGTLLRSWRWACTVEHKCMENSCRGVWDAWVQITREPKAMLRGMRRELADMRHESQALEQKLARRSVAGALCAASFLVCLLRLQRLKAGWRSKQDKLRGQLCAAGRRLNDLERCLYTRDQRLQGAIDALNQKADNDQRRFYHIIETTDTKHASALSSMDQELKNLIGSKDTEHVNALGTLRRELVSLIKAEDVERTNADSNLRHDMKDALTELVSAVNQRLFRRIKVRFLSRM